MALSQTMKEIAKEIGKVDFVNSGLCSAMGAYLKTEIQQKKMLEFMKSKEKIKYAELTAMLMQIYKEG